MANATDINGKVDNILTAIATEKQQFIDILNAKDAQIADLQNQLSNVVSSSEADAIASRLDDAAAQVATIVP